MRSLRLIITSVVLVSSGAILLKYGIDRVGELTFTSLADKLPLLVSNPYLILGVVLYALSSLTWLLAISNTELSKAYPILAMAYAMIPILSWLIFGDSMTTLRWVGVVIVFLGIMILGRS